MNASDTINVTSARAQMLRLIRALGEKYKQRENVAWDLVISAIAGQHLLLLGPPGTAKSAIVVDFANALGCRSFTRLLSKTSEPNELFGPWSLPGLKEGRYERCIDGYMPTAEVVFLDEIFKANSAILNTLLTIINERVFDQNSTRIKVPLKILVGASNEGPQDESLMALYDRFLVRRKVGYISSSSEFESMMFSDPVEIPDVHPMALSVLSDALDDVSLDKVKPMVITLWSEMERSHGIRPSDRRFKASMKLVRASALLRGRSMANASDLMVLASALSEKDEDIPVISNIIIKLRSPQFTQLVAMSDAAREKMKDLGDMGKFSMSSANRLGLAHQDIKRIMTEMERVIAQVDGDDQAEARAMLIDVSQMCTSMEQTMARIISGGAPL